MWNFGLYLQENSHKTLESKEYKMNKEDMTWEQERQILVKAKPKLLKIAEKCKHFLCGFCCESLDAGRTWECVFIRDGYKKGTEISCSKYGEE